MVLCDLNNSQREYLSRAQTPDLLSPKNLLVRAVASAAR